jgi:hypothetical protein
MYQTSLKMKEQFNMKLTTFEVGDVLQAFITTLIRFPFWTGNGGGLYLILYNSFL